MRARAFSACPAGRVSSAAQPCTVTTSVLLTAAPCAGLRIQRMPSEAGAEFGVPEEYPWMTVASPSCHDTSTSRAWYEQLDVAARERFWTEVSTGGRHAGCALDSAEVRCR